MSNAAAAGAGSPRARFGLLVWTVYLAVLLAPFEVPDPLGVGQAYALSLLTALAAALVLAVSGLPRLSRRDWVPWCLGVVMITATVGGWVADPGDRSMAALTALAVQIALFTAAMRAFEHSDAAWRIFVAVAVTAIGIGQLLALTYHVEVGLLDRPIGYPRPAGWSGYPELGLLLLVQIGLLLGCIERGQDRWLRRSATALIAIAIVELALLFSRLAWVAGAILLGLAALHAISRRSSKTIVVVAAGALAVAIVLYTQNVAFRMGVRSLAGLEPWWGTEQRPVIWSAALSLIGDNAWLGVGYGRFGVAFDNGYRPPGTLGGHAHNLWLHRVAELGVPGGIAYAALWIALLARGWRRLGRATPWLAGAVYALTAVAIRCAGDHMFAAPGGPPARLEALVWVLLAAVAARPITAAPRTPPSG